MIYTYPDGVQVDLTTGQVVGQEAAKTVTPAEARRPETVDIQPTSVGQGAIDALKQLSFGFNSALFALPDTVIKQVGKAAGVNDEEIPTFVSFFNRGQTAPKNAVERFANAIGQGAGGTLPVTGILGAVAKTRALAGPLAPGSGITKQLAKDTLDFIRANPVQAVALDLGFGGAYGAIEQGVEEVTEPGTTRDVLKATVPLAAVVAIPATGMKLVDLAKKVASISPTMRVAKAVGTPSPTVPGTEEFDFFHQAVSDTVPKVPGIRGPITMAGNYYGSRAQRTIGQALRDALVKDPGSLDQIALTNQIRDIAKREGFEDIEFIFALPESTLNGPLRAAYNEVVKNATPEVAGNISQRMDQNVKSFLEVASRMTPKTGMTMEEALLLHSAERTKVMDDALKQISDLSDAERLRLVDQFNAESNMADIGQTLRSGILAQREGLMNRFRTQVDALTSRPFGVRVPTREDGVAIDTLPSVPFKNFATGFMQKYKLTPDNRWFGGEVPAPAKELQRVLDRVQQTQDEALPNALAELVRARLMEKNKLFPNLNAAEQKTMVDTSVDGILRGVQGMDTPVERGLLKQAEEMAKKKMQVDLTLPEAVDFLQAAQRYKTHMFLKSQDDRAFGLQANFADQVKRNGEELLRDVEKFVFQSFKDVPGMKELQDVYENTFTKGYDNLFTLMATRRGPADKEFVWGDQRVIEEALKNRENLRALNTIFGENETYARYLEQAMLSKARAAGVINKDGLLDEAAYKRFLANTTRSGIMDELPASVQASLNNELKLGQSFAEELTRKQAAAEALKDNELDALLKKSLRPDADIEPLVQQALNDPATMRKIVNTVGQSEENLQAIRRKVWENVVERLRDPADPITIRDFMVRHGKSLNMIYTPEHMKNLELLAAIQDRVYAVARPSGVISPFQTFDEKLRAKIGAGVGTAESIARAAMIRQISPQHAVVSLMTRFLSRQQQSISDNILLNALTNPAYAQRLVSATAPITTPKGFNQAAKLTFEAGGFLPALLRNAPRVGSIEATQALEDQREIPVAEVAPEDIAPAARRTVIPPLPRPRGQLTAPPTPAPSMAQSPVARAVPAMPPQGQSRVNYEQYRMLFPTDVVSPMLPRQQ